MSFGIKMCFDCPSRFKCPIDNKALFTIMPAICNSHGFDPIRDFKVIGIPDRNNAEDLIVSLEEKLNVNDILSQCPCIDVGKLIFIKNPKDIPHSPVGSFCMLKFKPKVIKQYALSEV